MDDAEGRDPGSEASRSLAWRDLDDQHKDRTNIQHRRFMMNFLLSCLEIRLPREVEDINTRGG